MLIQCKQNPQYHGYIWYEYQNYITCPACKFVEFALEEMKRLKEQCHEFDEAEQARLTRQMWADGTI